jgi:hypothetical protein
MDERWAEGLLLKCETAWKERRDIEALGEAVALCGWNSLPLPEWSVDPILSGLALLNEHGGRGRGQSLRTKLEERQKHERRHAFVSWLRKHGASGGLTLERAFEEAAKAEKTVTADAIRKSYRAVEKAKKGN